MVKRILAGGFLLLMFVAAAWAEDSEISLDKIVVTPYRYEGTLSQTASSVTVISPSDIGNSDAQTSVDLLRSVPGIVVRDLYGNGAKTSIDLRGFGDTNAMNTLVLIDGRRINEVDQSGVDWSQIPLDQIEKIEIIRGGNSVLYGENAVGGVVNIITKKGSGKPMLKIGAEYGSFDRNLQRMNFSGSQGNLSYLVSGSRAGTNGYRNNSFFKNYDYGSKFTYDITPQLSVNFDSGFHRATYGMPGGLTESDMANFSRRYSKYGDDRATDKDYYFKSGIKNDIDNLGQLSLDVSYRIKDVNSDLIGGNGGWNPIRISNIDTLGLTPKLTINKTIFGRTNNIVTGVDFYRSFYSSDNLDSTNNFADITRIHKYSLGGYIQNELFLLDKLSLLGGFRYEAAKYIFNYHDFTGWYSDIDTKNTLNQKAYNVGINYKYADKSNLFLNLNRSFRFPATDEFFNGTLNTSLKPQVSVDLEAGIRHSFGNNIEFGISAYRMNVKDELFTDPTAASGLGATSNYGKTIHQGLDTNISVKTMDSLLLYGGYSYQDPIFHKGSFSGKTIPWVPNHKANMGLKYAFLKNFSLNVTENYIGSMYRINDVNNSLGKIKGYFTTDLGLNYKYNSLTIRASVNNLFNEYYYEFATYGSFSGNKVYYPAPGRSFGLKLDYEF